MNNRLIKSNDAGGGGACTNTVDLYNPFPDGGGVALWQFNNDTTDVSGNYDGTASTGMTYTQGVFGNAIRTTNETYFVNVPNLELSPSTAFSFSCWAYTTDKSQRVYLYNYSSGAGATSAWGGLINGKLYVNFCNNSIESTVDALENTWFHFAVSYDGLNAKVYLNGTEVINANLSSAALASNNLRMLDTISAWANPDASIDQVRVFNRVLRPYEVEALYTEEYCTPTIVPSEHFSVNVWDGGTIQSINTGFQPDLVWIKSMDVANNHNLADSVRGIDKILYSNLTNSEAERLNSIETTSTGYNLLDTWAGRNSASYNRYVGWSFKGGGAAVTNTDGTIASQVSANTEAGFSVVGWNGTTETSDTIGHGLSNAPTVVIMKNRTRTSDWFYYTSQKDGSWDYIRLNGTGIGGNSSRPLPTSDVFTQATMAGVIAAGDECIAYCFAEVEGFSNFGSYVGTDTRQGIVTGFEPAFVMIKRTDAANAWFMIDNQRFATNKYDRYLRPEVTDAQGGLNSAQYVAFYENGFSVETGSGLNGSGGKYIYMAFAADPTTIEPSLEDSFNTVLYTGNATARSITGVGFQPDFTWIKARSASAYAHRFFDSVRGATKILYSNVTNAEVTDVNSLISFENDGFNLGNEQYVNGSGIDFVAWNWKGAELPAINSNGSITSVVSANPAAGFSIVSYNSNGTAGSTIGHGLEAEPKMIIVKNRDDVDKWAVYHNYIGATDFLVLNETAAAVSSSSYWNNTSPNSNVFTVGETSPVNSPNNENYIAYCFAEVAGFSKFGSYTGTGASGNTIALGFEPAFVIIKNTNDTRNWLVFDNKRDPSAPAMLRVNTSDSEFSGNRIQFTSNGFVLQDADGSRNSNGWNYIYMAFANQF